MLRPVSHSDAVSALPVRSPVTPAGAETAPVSVEVPVTASVPATAVLPDADSTVNLSVLTSKLPSIPVLPVTFIAPDAVTSPVSVDAPVTAKVPAIAVSPDAEATVNLSVLISKSPSIPVSPVTSSVLLAVTAPVSVVVSSTLSTSVLSVPSKKPSLNCTPEEPRSSVLFVLASTLVADTTRSWLGPTFSIGAPSPAVPSCLCPVDALNADSTALYSASKSSASITLPLAMLFAIS